MPRRGMRCPATTALHPTWPWRSPDGRCLLQAQPSPHAPPRPIDAPFVRLPRRCRFGWPSCAPVIGNWCRPETLRSLGDRDQWSRTEPTLVRPRRIPSPGEEAFAFRAALAVALRLCLELLE